MSAPEDLRLRAARQSLLLLSFITFLSPLALTYAGTTDSSCAAVFAKADSKSRLRSAARFTRLKTLHDVQSGPFRLRLKWKIAESYTSASTVYLDEKAEYIVKFFPAVPPEGKAYGGQALSFYEYWVTRFLIEKQGRKDVLPVLSLSSGEVSKEKGYLIVRPYIIGETVDERIAKLPVPTYEFTQPIRDQVNQIGEEIVHGFKAEELVEFIRKEGHVANPRRILNRFPKWEGLDIKVDDWLFVQKTWILIDP